MKQVANKQNGFSLVEGLVALAVLSFSLLGIAGMISFGMKQTVSTSMYSHAVFHAYEMLDRLKANRDNATGGNYDFSLTTFANSPNSWSGSSQIVDVDRLAWLTSLEGYINGSSGAVACAGNVCRVTVQWDDSRASNEDVGTVTQSVVMAIEL